MKVRYLANRLKTDRFGNSTKSAAWASFLSRLLIERTFFQNTVIPRDAMLYLANDLMRTLVPQTTETLSVSKELVIMWKQLRGQPLTAEEQAYENSPKEIDVVGEILNGMSLGHRIDWEKSGGFHSIRDHSGVLEPRPGDCRLFRNCSSRFPGSCIRCE